MLEWQERVNRGKYILLHNVVPGRSALGQFQPLSIQPGERLVTAKSSQSHSPASEAMSYFVSWAHSSLVCTRRVKSHSISRMRI
jgi:hypothetical protein